MGKDTQIEWADDTFNPWIGCTMKSEGCTNCYAEAIQGRFGGGLWGPKARRYRTAPSNWAKPIQWARAAAAAGQRRSVFCASLADWAEDREDLAPWRADLWELIAETGYALDWLMLSKRPENFAAFLPWGADGDPWPWVWLGTTAENQERADERLPILSSVRAARRFVSYEPAVGPVDLAEHLALIDADAVGGDPDAAVALQELAVEEPASVPWSQRSIHWVIAGGESGHRARPARLDWFRDVRDQCAVAGVPFFYKQGPTDLVPLAKGCPRLDGVQHAAIPSSACPPPSRAQAVLL